MATLKATLKVSATNNGVLHSLDTPNFNGTLTANKDWYLDMSSLNGKPQTRYIVKRQINATNNSFGTSASSIGKRNIVFGKDTFLGARFDNAGLVDEGGYDGYIFSTESEYLELHLDNEGGDVFSITFGFDEKANQRPIGVYYWLRTPSNELIGSTTEVEYVQRPNSLWRPIALPQGAYYQKITDWSVTITSPSYSNSIAVVRFVDWSNREYPYCIKHISIAPPDLELSSREIESISSTIEVASNGNDITYQAMQSTGDIMVRDMSMVGGEISIFEQYAQKNWLKPTQNSIVVKLNDTILRTHSINGSPRIDKDNSMELQLSDALQMLEAITMPEKTYGVGTNPLTLIGEISAKARESFLTIVFSMTDNVFITPFDANGTNDASNNLYMSISTYLGCIQAKASFTLKEESALVRLNKICEIFQLNCVIGNRGELVLVSARNITGSQRSKYIIDIPTRLQASDIKYDILKHNRVIKVVTQR